jgi:hypothetical protein
LFRGDYIGDNFATKNKTLGFMHEPRFAAAYQWSAHTAYLGKEPPWASTDLRWRAHICVWVAKRALKLEGDFAECGVDTAVTSGTIVKYLDFGRLDRSFFLFDTFSGIPDVEGMTESEKDARRLLNDKFYFNSFGFVAAKMAEYRNVRLVQGVLPDTLDALAGRKISYLSIDLNNAVSEKSVMERLWPQLTPGAIVVIDDYAFGGHDPQYAMWNAFAAERDLMIATLPTGQGLLIKAD